MSGNFGPRSGDVTNIQGAEETDVELGPTKPATPAVEDDTNPKAPTQGAKTAQRPPPPPLSQEDLERIKALGGAPKQPTIDIPKVDVEEESPTSPGGSVIGDPEAITPRTPEPDVTPQRPSAADVGDMIRGATRALNAAVVEAVASHQQRADARDQIPELEEALRNTELLREEAQALAGHPLQDKVTAFIELIEDRANPEAIKAAGETILSDIDNEGSAKFDPDLIVEIQTATQTAAELVEVTKVAGLDRPFESLHEIKQQAVALFADGIDPSQPDAEYRQDAVNEYKKEIAEAYAQAADINQVLSQGGPEQFERQLAKVTGLQSNGTEQTFEQALKDSGFMGWEQFIARQAHEEKVRMGNYSAVETSRMSWEDTPIGQVIVAAKTHPDPLAAVTKVVSDLKAFAQNPPEGFSQTQVDNIVQQTMLGVSMHVLNEPKHRALSNQIHHLSTHNDSMDFLTQTTQALESAQIEQALAVSNQSPKVSEKTQAMLDGIKANVIASKQKKFGGVGYMLHSLGLIAMKKYETLEKAVLAIEKNPQLSAEVKDVMIQMTLQKGIEFANRPDVDSHFGSDIEPFLSAEHLKPKEAVIQGYLQDRIAHLEGVIKEKMASVEASTQATNLEMTAAFEAQCNQPSIEVLQSEVMHLQKMASEPNGALLQERFYQEVMQEPPGTNASDYYNEMLVKTTANSIDKLEAAANEPEDPQRNARIKPTMNPSPPGSNH